MTRNIQSNFSFFNEEGGNRSLTLQQKEKKVMAFLDPVSPFPAPRPIMKFWNVSADVGPIEFGAYPKDDVMLVQTLLLGVISSTSGSPPGKLISFPKGALSVDGIFGPITKSWVRWYQQVKDLVDDEQVSRVWGKAVGSMSHKMYAIVSLNIDFNNANPDWHHRLHLDARTHPTLRAALIRNWPSGVPREF
jgi:hypothetical protein